jgi:hypothetical protein
VISKQRVAARAVDQDVSRLEHRHRVLRRHDGLGALYRVRFPLINQIAEVALDGVERAEPQCPFAKKCLQVRRDGLSEGEALPELCWIEDGRDAISIDGIGTVGFDRVRHEVRCKLNHPGARVLVPLLIETHREPLHRLEQCREHKTHGSCADHMYSSRGRHGF